jgi:NAD(P)H-hydrate repair Nnr-like enzyme with NAD(P)H-hydrate dehydratase domain
VQADRLAAADTLARRWRCVVVLKGSGTVIAAPGRPPAINPTGNARLASPGSGDVLAGWIAGRWAQDGGDGYDSALRGVFEHGLAAEGHAGAVLPASRLIDALGR